MLKENKMEYMLKGCLPVSLIFYLIGEFSGYEAPLWVILFPFILWIFMEIITSVI